jgi:hypothetical protein
MLKSKLHNKSGSIYDELNKNIQYQRHIIRIC